jgi:hypothetical protein
VGGEDEFHDALRAAIRSNERYDTARETIDQSRRLSENARDLIETSRMLLRETSKRLARQGQR